MKIEDVSTSVASLADKVADYHARLIVLEREIKNLKEVKNGYGKTKSGEQLSKT